MQKAMIEITSPKPRRRAGMKFGPEPVCIDASELSEVQLNALRDDPLLVIRAAVDEAESEAPPPPEKSEPDNGPAHIEARFEQIRAAIEKLKPEDFTQKGKPKISALEDHLGWKPEREEIDAVVSKPD